MSNNNNEGYNYSRVFIATNELCLIIKLSTVTELNSDLI
jgi:hypothetical protein